jgi:hypothetical protein
MAKTINAKRRRTVKRPRQPSDLTLRNLHAAKKRLDAISMELDALQARVTNLEASQPEPGPEPSVEDDPLADS